MAQLHEYGATRLAQLICAGLWREDLCLLAAELIERAAGPGSPIDPVRD